MAVLFPVHVDLVFVRDDTTISREVNNQDGSKMIALEINQLDVMLDVRADERALTVDLHSMLPFCVRLTFIDTEVDWNPF